MSTLRSIVLLVAIMMFVTLSASATKMVSVRLEPASIPTLFINYLNAIAKLSNGCTLTHVGNGIAVTAGHCFKAKSEKQFNKTCAWITAKWGYHIGSQHLLTSRCQNIIVMQKNENVDYAILKFAKYPEEIVPVDISQFKSLGRQISLFGHPWGALLHWSSQCTVQSSENSNDAGVDQYTHDCDSEPGYSGGPIIDSVTGKMFGLHNGGKRPWFFGTFLSNIPLAEYL